MHQKKVQKWTEPLNVPTIINWIAFHKNRAEATIDANKATFLSLPWISEQ